MDRDTPLEDRVWRALERTCRLHAPRGHCPACDERWAAVMLAFSPERDRILRHDAIVDTVVRDRITESRKAERHRLAWLSAKRGRIQERRLREAASEAHAETWDRMERHRENAAMNARDFRTALTAAECWKSKAERYRLAWKSACQGRKNWRKLYEYAQGKWYILDKQNISRAYHDLMMRAYRNQVNGLEAALEDRERKLAGVSRVRADLRETLEVLGDDHVTAWTRVRELEAELADLRLAFSEMEGAKAHEEDSGGS